MTVAGRVACYAELGGAANCKRQHSFFGRNVEDERRLVEVVTFRKPDNFRLLDRHNDLAARAAALELRERVAKLGERIRAVHDRL